MDELAELLQRMRAYLIDPGQRGALLDLCDSFVWPYQPQGVEKVVTAIVGEIEHIAVLIAEQNPGFEYTEQELRQRVLDLLLRWHSHGQTAASGANSTTITGVAIA